MDLSIIPLFIGTYTRTGQSKGIYVYDFCTKTGKAVMNRVIAAEDPSFITISSDRKLLYAVSEKAPLGAVNEYRYDEEDGKITFLNQVSTAGVSPCHITIDRGSRHVIVSNYRSGNLNVFSLCPNGELGKLIQTIEYEGHGPHSHRQDHPHIHSAFFSSDEHIVFVQDLGSDRVYVYQYCPDDDNFPLQPMSIPFIKCFSGSGPRHMAISRDNKYIYIVHELNGIVTVYKHDRGNLWAIQEISINEEDFDGVDGASEIKLSSDGNFLYAANRGDANTLAVYAVDAKSGLLTKIANQSVLGLSPRHYTISPNGEFLLIANQHSDEVVVFKRNKYTGLLCDSGERIFVAAPACLLF